MRIQGQIVDIRAKRIFSGEIELKDGKIASITEKAVDSKLYIMPGFVDAHVHIESSMLVPSEFARLAVVHGTVATVSDPHEIGNVLGIPGVKFMLDNGEKVPFKFYFGAPSCVPATSFETAGAVIGPDGIRELLSDPRIVYLAEMMNYPGVIFDDAVVHEKIKIAHELGKVVDGHAPGVSGDDLKKYIAAGITTDHECFTYEEALEKINLGMKILIREGSAAKNFEALIDLLDEFPDKIMLCSDDKHPDELILGHVNKLAARAVAKGIDIFKVLQACCLNPVEHYGLNVGQMRTGEPADFISVKDLKDFEVVSTWIDGELVAKDGVSLIQSVPVDSPNQFSIGPIQKEALKIAATSENIRVIEAKDGELVTQGKIHKAKIEDGFYVSDTEHDILKMVMVNRYQDAPISVAFIQNIGIKEGALASCVGHDSHNLIAVGTDDESLCRAINLIIENQGGISAVSANEEKILPLPVAGIMTTEDGYTVGKAYASIDKLAKQMGSTLSAPFMTLSFMGLLVIPSLKLSDKGLFDGDKFEFVDIAVD